METSAHANDLVKHHLKTFEMQIIEDDTKQVKENKENKINLKTRVYLTNLPSDVTQDDLYVMFNSVGLKTTELHIPLDIQGRSKPHALVFFKTEKDAKEAVKLLDSTLLHG